MHRQIRHSFPSKLPTFLAAGRPVFFHGPEEAAGGRFLRENSAAACCHSLEPKEIRRQLEFVLSDRARYAELAKQGREAFDRHLTLERMREAIAKLLGIESQELLLPASGEETAS